ncbi:MAG: ferrochelatase [Thermoguttaceae bacterium]
MSDPTADLPPSGDSETPPNRRDKPGGSLPPPSYDALLVVSFGGPEGPDEVMPFLKNVARGKNVPPQRLQEVARHYEPFGGVSPANAQVRALVFALVTELNAHGPRLPVYWGNRHWHPLLGDTVRQMAEDGVRRALAFVTSAFGSYPGCGQYVKDIAAACQEAGAEAPRIDKLRLFYNHPGFIEAMADRVWDALESLPAERRAAARLVYTAHSVPASMTCNCSYQQQLQEACALVSQRLGHAPWHLAYQSRSGPPGQTWLEPDVADYLRALAAGGGSRDVVLAPIGFVCENMETVYDLDVEVGRLCEELGLNLVRSGVVGSHRRFVQMIRELVLERTETKPTRLALGSHGPGADFCEPHSEGLEIRD